MFAKDLPKTRPLAEWESSLEGMDISGASQEPWGGVKPWAEPVVEPSCTGAAGEDFCLPLVDSAVLEELDEELFPSDLAATFARDYVGFWPERERRLMDALAAGELKAALDAAISMKVASDMVGARRLAAVALALESAVRAGDMTGGPARDLVSLHGRATIEELQAQFVRADQ